MSFALAALFVFWDVVEKAPVRIDGARPANTLSAVCKTYPYKRGG